MEFWGLEVKPGSTVKCEPGHGFILHVSQAALGESKKSDSALMYVKVDDKKLAIGTLSIDKYPQIQFDLVFNKEFELSHTSKTTSVFFSGYKVEQPIEGDEMDLDSEDEEEELNIPVIKENGKGDGKEEQKNQEKAVAATASKSSLGLEKKSKDDSDDSDEDESDDSDEDDSDDSDEGEGLSPDEGDDDSSDEDDTSDDDEEETPTPKKPEAGKKRGAENALKTPLSDKKAKVATPPAQKTGGKKGATHVATPHPAKGKTPANNDKSTEKSPKSGGSVPCKSCSKTFNSEMALQAHSKAKHGAK
ncbi:Histone deacetylase HDT2 [Zea mays]|uniref:Histone deacetylase HDT2 n=2 Tax=Zea mays TaxID=4577 RepID=A0A3L6DMK1_MAIZE|nr:Histone deacetylase HDT2 [Zea mays]